MNELTLGWHEAGQARTQKICDQQPSKNSGTIRIGRNPSQCDIVLTDPTVSGLHVEIFFQPQQSCFYLRNLRTSNPPIVDGKQLLQREVALSQGSVIYLGQVEVVVVAISLLAVGNIPDTILITPQRQVEQVEVSLKPMLLLAAASFGQVG